MQKLNETFCIKWIIYGNIFMEIKSKETGWDAKMEVIKFLLDGIMYGTVNFHCFRNKKN